ncbi:MAG: hypothetical protein ACREAC_25115, partial [Blastocatellia bacterium]
PYDAPLSAPASQRPLTSRRGSCKGSPNVPNIQRNTPGDFESNFVEGVQIRSHLKPLEGAVREEKRGKARHPALCLWPTGAKWDS